MGDRFNFVQLGTAAMSESMSPCHAQKTSFYHTFSSLHFFGFLNVLSALEGVMSILHLGSNPSPSLFLAF